MLAKEREDRADEEQAVGKYREFNTIQEVIADLHWEDVNFCPQCGLVIYPESASDMHCGGNQ